MIAVFTHSAYSYYMNELLAAEGLLRLVIMSYMNAGITHGTREVFEVRNKASIFMKILNDVEKVVTHDIS